MHPQRTEVQEKLSFENKNSLLANDRADGSVQGKNSAQVVSQSGTFFSKSITDKIQYLEGEEQPASQSM